MCGSVLVGGRYITEEWEGGREPSKGTVDRRRAISRELVEKGKREGEGTTHSGERSPRVFMSEAE